MVEESFVIDEENMLTEKTLRVFISYSNKDNEVARLIKREFDNYEIRAFLAHEDIEVGQEWRGIILENLKKSNIFVAILSENFINSEWTNQEVGFAICKGDLIVTVSIDGTGLYGFLEMFQALREFESRDLTNPFVCQDLVLEILKISATKEDLRDDLKDSLIRRLAKRNKYGRPHPDSYRDSENYFGLLYSLKPFTKDQINEIVKRSIENNQIYGASGCRDILKDLLEEYGTHIISENKSKLSGLITR